MSLRTVAVVSNEDEDDRSVRNEADEEELRMRNRLAGRGCERPPWIDEDTGGGVESVACSSDARDA